MASRQGVVARSSSSGYPVSHVLVMMLVGTILLLLIMWGSLMSRLSSVTVQVDESIGKRLEELETSVKLVRELLGDKRVMSARQQSIAGVLSRRKAEVVAGQTTVRLAFTTMRRGVPNEHVYETIDSLLPFLGGEDSLHFSATVVDVEQDGEFALEIENKYPELVKNGLLMVKRLDKRARELLYEGLVKVLKALFEKVLILKERQTCDMARLYGDDLTRTIWRSKRVLDFVFGVRMASLGRPDYIMVLEDDTPILGSLTDGVQKYANTSTACRWDFHWERKVALSKVFPVDHEKNTANPRLMYPQGNLQGVFALMLPTSDWLSMCNFMRASFDLAPADWLIGRWLFQNNWRIAFLPPALAVYHCAGSSFQDSSRIAVAKSLASDPMFKGKPLSWHECDAARSAWHPFKWEDFKTFRLRWVSGADFFLELPHIDIDGHDIGIARDSSLMDEDARLIICAMTPECVAVNRNGWMKSDLVIEDVGAADKSKHTLLRVPGNSTSARLEKIKTFFLACVAKLPGGRMPKQKP